MGSRDTGFYLFTFKTLTRNFNILSNTDADADAKADAVVTAIALPVLMYRRAKKEKNLLKLKYMSFG